MSSQQEESESKARDGVKKRVGRRKRGCLFTGGNSKEEKRKKEFSFFSKEPFPFHPCLSPPVQGSSPLLFVEEMSIFYFPSRILSAAACSLSVSVHRESSVGREL